MEHLCNETDQIHNKQGIFLKSLQKYQLITEPVILHINRNM